MGQPGPVVMDAQQPAYYPHVDPNIHAPANYPPQAPIATQPVVHGAMPTPGYPGHAAEQPVQYYPVPAEAR